MSVTKTIPRRYPTPRAQWVEVARSLHDEGATLAEIVRIMQVTPNQARSLLGFVGWWKP